MSVDVGSAVGYLDLDIQGFLKGLHTAQSEADKASQSVNSALSGIGNGLQTVGDKIAGAGKALTVGITVPIVTAITASIKEYAKLEQSIGGVETMFKSSSATVIRNSETAYKRAGVSANGYMEQITSFSARLLQGLGGDTERAAEIADMAMVDMSDNANKFGTDISMIQNAYQGFAKANFTMLDNLKLGYGGTASEMARLINDTGVMGKEFVATAENVKDIPFDALIEAIHKVQEEMGVAGTTAYEASTTISGSFGMVKSAFQDFLAGLGNKDANMKQLTDNLVEAVKVAFERIKEVLKTIWDNLPLSPLQKKAIAIAAALGPVLLVIGKIVSGIGSLISTISSISGAIGSIKTGMTALSAVTTSSGATLGATFTAALAPIALVVAAVGVLAAAFATLWKNNEEFRDKMTGIWDGIKEKVDGFLQGLVDRINELGFDFKDITEVLSALWNGFCELLAPVFEGAFAIIADTLGYVLDTILNVFDIFVGIFTGDWDKVWNGVKGIFEDTWNFIKSTFENVWATIKGVLDVALGWFGTSWDELWTSVGQFFTDTWNSIKQFFVDTWNSIVSFFTEGIPAFVENAKQMGSQFLENIVLFFQELPFKIGEFIGLAIGTVAKWVIDMVDKAKEMGTNFINAVVEFFTTLPGKIAEFITKAYNSVVKWATDMPSKAKEMGRNFIDSVVKFFSELPGKIWDWLTKAINKVKQWVIDMGTNGTKAIKNLIDNVVNGAKEIPGKMLQIGKNIVEGIWSGIQNAAAWFSDQVSSFFSGIVNGIKKGLGISSPSKVFADQIGKWLPPGIANGFRSALPEAINKMQGDLDKSALSLEKDLQVEQDISANSFMEFLGGFDGAVGRFTESVQRLLNAGREFVYTGLFNERSSASKDVVGGQYRNDIKIDITVEAKVASDYDVQNLGKELGVSVERELRSKGVAVV